MMDKFISSILFFLVFLITCFYPGKGFVAALACPSKWVAFGNEKCFLYSDATVKHQDAYFLCKGKNANATLVSVHSTEEERFLVSMVRQHLAGHHQWVWLGSKRTPENSSFTWVDATPFNYANWHEGEGYSCPDIAPGRDCVAMGIFAESATKWCNFGCEGNAFHHFCQIVNPNNPYYHSKQYDQTRHQPEEARIWRENKATIYEVANMTLRRFPGRVSGEEAPLICSFGEMITLHSAEEEDELLEYLVRNLTVDSPILIGAKRNGTDTRDFIWTDGSNISYTNWAYNEPDFKNNDEYCVVLDPTARVWMDVSCSEKYILFCDEYLDDPVVEEVRNSLLQYLFEMKEMSVIIWIIILTLCSILVIFVVFIYYKIKERVSRMALELTHETPVYCDIRKQTDCECFSNFHDT